MERIEYEIPLRSEPPRVKTPYRWPIHRESDLDTEAIDSNSNARMNAT